MRLRQLALSLTTAGALVAGLGLPADAAGVGFTVSDTNVTTGSTIGVQLTDGCLDANGDRGYGVIDVYNDDTGVKLAQLKYKDDAFFTGDTVTFPKAGNYHLSRSCDNHYTGSISVVVTDPAPTTTAAPTTTTTAPVAVETETVEQPAPAPAPAAKPVVADIAYTG